MKALFFLALGLLAAPAAFARDFTTHYEGCRALQGKSFSGSLTLVNRQFELGGVPYYLTDISPGVKSGEMIFAFTEPGYGINTLYLVCNLDQAAQ